MNFKNIRFIKNTFNPQQCSKAAYSRRNNSNQEKFYKVVGKVENSSNDSQNNSALAPVPNWELLRPRGYRFFLPGNVGPGWHDVKSNPHSLPQLQDFDLISTDFKCYAQECPVLLRQSVTELFPGVDFSYTRLTVISLSHKNLKQIAENELEDTAKTFVLAAQDICQKLRTAGYWADFINPFSGLPGASTYNTSVNLYETDPRFRSLGFRIIERQNCRVIEDKKSCRFRGNLFTTAPAETEALRKILLP